MGLGRVELPTSRLSGVRSNHLSYRPLSNRLGLLAQKSPFKDRITCTANRMDIDLRVIERSEEKHRTPDNTP